MTLPRVLYHGTTMLRWAMIKRDRLLRCNMPKSFEAEEYVGLKGYVFLTDNIDEAIMHGLGRSLLDKPYPDSNYRDPLVIGVNTSKLEDNLEINYGINTPLVKQTPVKFNEDSQSYKYKGDIKLEHLFAYRYVPFSAFGNNSINQMMKHHEKKLQASQSIMERLPPQSTMKQINRLAPQSVMKQISSVLKNGTN